MYTLRLLIQTCKSSPFLGFKHKLLIEDVYVILFRINNDYICTYEFYT